MADDQREGGSGRPLQRQAVGYGRPPSEYRFQKGAPSANPFGRGGKPRRSSPADQAPDFLDSKVVLLIDGERRSLTREEAIDHALYMAAIKGSVAAVSKLEARRAQRERRRAEVERAAAANLGAVPLSEEDDAVITNALRRRTHGSGAGTPAKVETDDEAAADREYVDE